VGQVRRILSLALALAVSARCDGTPSPVGIEPAEILWAVPVSERAAGPVLIGGRVLVAEPGSLSALDPSTGALAWSVDLGAASRSIPGLTARGDAAYGIDARLVAARIGDGAILWSTPDPPPGIFAADAERLYVFGAGSIAAINPGSGAVLWEAPVVQPYRLVALGGGFVCVAGDAILCHEGASGRLLWIATPPDGSLLVDLDVGPGRTVASTLSGELLAYDRRTGTLVWRHDLGAPIEGTTAAGLMVHACSGGQDPGGTGICVALEESSGVVRWRIATRGGTSTPLAREGVVVVIDGRAVVVVDAGTGRVVRRIAHPREGFRLALPAYSGGVLYARLGREILALRLSP